MKYEVERTCCDVPILLHAAFGPMGCVALVGVGLPYGTANRPMLASTQAPAAFFRAHVGGRLAATPPRPPAKVRLESPSLLRFPVAYADRRGGRKNSPKKFRELFSWLLGLWGECVGPIR
jgi:hypothetical protein